MPEFITNAANRDVIFYRMGDPIFLPCNPLTATQTAIGVALAGGSPRADGTQWTGRIPPGSQSFWIFNPNRWHVRLKGSSGKYVAVTPQTGWCFSYGGVGPFSTQYPDWISTLSVDSPDAAAGTGFIEISYGTGG